jgi:hypothetical protein
MNNPISPFEKWRLETIPQVGFTPEIHQLLVLAFEGGRKSLEEKVVLSVAEIRQMHKDIQWYQQELQKKEWKSLSDDEIANLETSYDIKMSHDTWEFDFYGFARAIDQALKEKNHDIVDLLQATAK